MMLLEANMVFLINASCLLVFHRGMLQHNYWVIRDAINHQNQTRNQGKRRKFGGSKMKVCKFCTALGTELLE